MKYVKSFPLFEGNMEDAKYAESVYLHSTEGRDLHAINYHYGGYRLPRTGNFFITERYSEYRIEKNTSGKWTATTTTKAKIDIGEFNTVEECFRRIWAWLIIKSGIPSGARIKEYTDWLMNPSCPVWGKNLPLQKIEEEYIKELQSTSPGLVDDIKKLFASRFWKSRFDLIGLDFESHQYSGGHFTFSIYSYYMRATDSNAPFIKLWQTFEPGLFTDARKHSDITIPGFSVQLSLRKEFKTKNDQGTLRIKIGDTSVETIERKIITRYVKELAKTPIQGYDPGEHPLLRFLIGVLTDNVDGDIFKTVCQIFADMVEKDPKQIVNIPPTYAKEVSRMTGFGDDEIDAIKMSSEFGLI